MSPQNADLEPLTRRDVLRRGVAASALGVATVPTTVSARRCDAVVSDDYPTIQAAVDDATDGDTICIRQGTYDEDVEVDVGVTLAGRTAPGSSNPAHVDGQIEVTGSGSGATIRRLRIASSKTYPGGTFPDPAGVLVKASDVTVERNVVENFRANLANGQGSFTLHGVQVFGAGVSDVTVRRNVIRGFQSDGVPGEWPKYGGIAAVKAQAGVQDVDVRGNRITDHHSAGWVWGVVLTPSGSAPGAPSNITVENNHLAGLNDGSVYDVFAGPNDGRDAAPYPGSSFGIDGTADASEATVQRNDLLAPNGAESKDGDGTLVAECNWWGDRSGPTHADNSDGDGTWALERGSATIDYTPWLVASAPSRACVGGEDDGDSGGGPGGRP